MLPRKTQLALSGLAATASFLLPFPCQANWGDCGQPLTNGFRPVATDARRVLTAALGVSLCSDVLDACIYDVNDSGVINSTDALLVLQNAVGQYVLLDCGPNCPPISSTTSSTTSSTSTTMEPGEDNFFDITFELLSGPSFPIGALQFSTDYSAAGGTFNGAGLTTACKLTANMADAIAAFFDDDLRSELTTGVASGTGFSGPRDIMTCRFIDYDGVAPVAADFVTTVTECVNPQTLAKLPNCFMLVRSVSACVCGDGVVNCVTETCDDGNTSDGDGCSSTCDVEP